MNLSFLEIMNRLVTFGDSFIAQRNYFKDIKPKSWLDIICKENDFELDGYGCSETGILNTIMNFKGIEYIISNTNG